MRGVRGSVLIVASLVGFVLAIAAQTPRAQKFLGITLDRSRQTPYDSRTDCVSVLADGTFHWERRTTALHPQFETGPTPGLPQQPETRSALPDGGPPTAAPLGSRLPDDPGPGNTWPGGSPKGSEPIVRRVPHDADQYANVVDIYEGKLAPPDLEALLAAINNDAFNAVRTQSSPAPSSGDDISISVYRAAGSQSLQFWGDQFRNHYKANLKPLFAWWTAFERQGFAKSQTAHPTGCRLPSLYFRGGRHIVATGSLTVGNSGTPPPTPSPACLAPTQPATREQPATATLYSAIVYKTASRAGYNFQQSRYATRGISPDVLYGTMSIGNDWDWFTPGRSYGTRSTVRDLGETNWSDQIDIPNLPLPPELTAEEIKGGKRPVITVNSSAGKYESWRAEAEREATFSRVFPGHIYALHVADACGDYYVLFRVESLTRGDHCTISWRRVPTPAGTP